jgi:hypothetical protein
MVAINYNAIEKRFFMAYTYYTKRKLARNANPKPRTFRALATQVLRAQSRGQTTFSWQLTVAEPVFSLEGSRSECYLYRFENGNLLTVNAGTFVEVLRYLYLLSRNGYEYHRNAVKNFQFNVNVS